MKCGDTCQQKALAFFEVNPPGRGMNTKQRYLGYRRNLAAWVDMMRARQAAEVAAAKAEAEAIAEPEVKDGGEKKPPRAAPQPAKSQADRKPARARQREARGVAALARAWPEMADEDGMPAFLRRRPQGGFVELLSRPRAISEPCLFPVSRLLPTVWDETEPIQSPKRQKLYKRLQKAHFPLLSLSYTGLYKCHHHPATPAEAMAGWTEALAHWNPRRQG